MHTVLLADLPHFRKIPRLIHVAAVLVDVLPTTSAKVTAPAFYAVLADGDKSVCVAMWKAPGSRVFVSTALGDEALNPMHIDVV